MADRTVRAIITGSSAGAVAAFAETSLAADKAGQGAAKSMEDSSKRQQAALKSIGAGLLAAGAVMVGVGAAAVDLAAKYQGTTDQMAASAGISVAAAQKIGGAFLATGGQTTLSAQQMMAAFAPVAGQFASLNGGALTASESLTVMQAAMALAEATGGDLTTTTSDLAKIMQTFAVPVSNAAAASDTLFNSARALGVPVDALTTSLQRARTSAGAAAPSLGDLNAFLLDLQAHGESGRGAMALLGPALLGIEAPTKAVTKAQQEMGISFINARTGALDPLAAIIAKVHPLIAGMGSAQATATLKSIGFGASASKLVDLMQAGTPAFTAATNAVDKHGTAAKGAEVATRGLNGTFDKLKAQVIDAGISLGQKLLPAVTHIMGWFSSIMPTALKVVSGLFNALGSAVQFISNNFAIFGPIIGGVVAGFTAYFVITKLMAAWTVIATAAQAGFNLVMDANPVAIVILAIAALVAIIIVVATHFKQITAVARTVWKDVSGFFANLWHDVTGTVGNIVSDVVGFFTGLPGKIGAAIGPIASFLTAPFRDAFDIIARLWNSTLGSFAITIPGWVPLIGGKGFSFPKMPILDAGGIISSPTVALLAANSQPEAVVPLSGLSSGALGGGGGGGGGNTYMTIHVNGGDPNAVVVALKQWMQQNGGSLPVTVNAARRLGAA